MSAKTSILLIEDDEATRGLLSSYFKNEGFSVVACGDGASGRLEIATHDFSALLLDVNLPDDDGFDLLREVRANYPGLPVILVTSRSAEIDKVLGLELGADDYVEKPFSLPELRARVRAILRRTSSSKNGYKGGEPEKLGNWYVDLTRREITDQEGQLIRLTRGEFDMFAALLQHKGVPVSRDYLLDVISANSTEASDRTVDTLVSRIRSKLRERKNHALIIETVRGIGYRLLDVSNLGSGTSSQKSA